MARLNFGREDTKICGGEGLSYSFGGTPKARQPLILLEVLLKPGSL